MLLGPYLITAIKISLISTPLSSSSTSSSQVPFCLDDEMGEISYRRLNVIFTSVPRILSGPIVYLVEYRAP